MIVLSGGMITMLSWAGVGVIDGVSGGVGVKDLVGSLVGDCEAV